MTAPVETLGLRGICKQFGPTLALDEASFALRRGTVHALLGENGAGKTTLMRVAFGLLQPDAGTLEVDGSPKTWRSNGDAIRAGIGMVHQHFSLVGAMTVAENVALGTGGVFGRFDRAETRTQVQLAAEASGLKVPPDALAAQLSVSEQQRTEIVKALVRNARILILDEPTAVLTPAEGHELFAWLKRFALAGSSVVLITHKVREALAVADDVTVLRRGRTVLAGATSSLGERAVVDAMLGIETSSTRDESRSLSPPGQVVLGLAGVTARSPEDRVTLRDVSLRVHAGEIVGVAGVEGAGQYTLLRVLGGRLKAQRGDVILPRRIGFVPADRHRDALVPPLTLVENFALLGLGERRGLMHWPRVESDTRAALERLNVRAPGPRAEAASLSGGNQQKFVLARELSGNPPAVVAENPTRGLDLRASETVLNHLRRARDGGVAVVLYSNDLDELVEIADRVIVCFDGRLREARATVSDIGRAMVGAE